MSFVLKNLDQRTRELMFDEVDRDVAEGRLYMSLRFTPAGMASWEMLFRAACQSGDEVSLTAALGAPGGVHLNAREASSTSISGDKAVPPNAAATVAEGEFNRFYIRALCRRALDDGAGLEIYRARASSNPDSASEAKIGELIDAQAVLDDLRVNIGVAPALGLPSHPNTGLSVFLVA